MVRRPRRRTECRSSYCRVGAAPAFAISNDDVRLALEQRFKGDRTGACIAAGVIATAYYCADPKSQRPYDEHTAFEIGSVTKTMTAALLAEFIARGDVTLGRALRIVLTVMVPYCVSTYSSVCAIRAHFQSRADSAR